MSSSCSPLGPSPQLHPRTSALLWTPWSPTCINNSNSSVNNVSQTKHFIFLCWLWWMFSDMLFWSLFPYKTCTDMVSCQPGACHSLSGKSIMMQTWWSSTGMNTFYHVCAHVLSVPSLWWIPWNIYYISFLGTELHELLRDDSSAGIGWHISSCIQSTENK